MTGAVFFLLVFVCLLVGFCLFVRGWGEVVCSVVVVVADVVVVVVVVVVI